MLEQGWVHKVELGLAEVQALQRCMKVVAMARRSKVGGRESEEHKTKVEAAAASFHTRKEVGGMPEFGSFGFRYLDPDMSQFQLRCKFSFGHRIRIRMRH